MKESRLDFMGKEKIRKRFKKKCSDIGILTFHCADNYGAMLQAFGLKNHLLEKGLNVEIIDYRPPYMTGRHWWMPFIPARDFLYALKEWIYHLQMGKSFFLRRNNMKSFRRKYLIEKGQKQIFFMYQFRNLSYRCYIVGSDQIWNPDITFGLRKAYFGAFESKNKKKVIAYAASLGGTELSGEYDDEFARLLRFVNAVSVREKEAVPYIKRFFQGDVTVVPDPVLLLKQEAWQKVEVLSGRSGYILIYMTERNDTLIACAKKLSYIKKLPVIELRSEAGKGDITFITDYVAGPSEFLGYIHGADYVLTNSFHGIAFSIIYHKKFQAFLHKSLGVRLRNILEICELEDRICERGQRFDIDSDIEWNCVDRHLEEYIEAAEEFIENAFCMFL